MSCRCAQPQRSAASPGGDLTAAAHSIAADWVAGQVFEPAPDAGTDVLAALERCLQRAGMAADDVLSGFVEAWMWRFCPV